MKTVSKKLFSLLLVAVLLVSAIPFQVFADETEIIIEGEETSSAAESEITVEGDGEEKKEEKVDHTGEKYVLTLDAGKGTIDGNSTATRKVTYGKSVGELPVPTRKHYTFVGWFNADGKELTDNQKWKTASDDTYTAKYKANKNELTISAVKSSKGEQVDSYTLFTDNVMENELLLAYLNENYKSLIEVPAGYAWDKLWYKNAASQPLEDQDTAADANRAVFVKFFAKKYTLSFDAKGGTVDPESKTVYFDSAIGKLPTPEKEGAVFSHWVDEDGNKVTSKTIYKVPGDSKLIAVYKGEVKVYLHMHTEKSLAGGIIKPLAGYVAGDEITQTIAMNVVKQYYSGKMTFAGLFTDSDWKQYVNGDGPTGKNFVEIPQGDSVTIHVMIKNATLGTSGDKDDDDDDKETVKPTTKPTSKPDSSNPKTGDTGMIYIASTTMVMAAAALAVVLQLRKKRII